MCLRSLLAVFSAPLFYFLTFPAQAQAQAEEGILVEMTYRTLGTEEEEEKISGEIFFENGL
jgi:hypothetical protein